MTLEPVQPEQAQQAQALAQLQLDRATVKSPVTGVVLTRNLEIGDLLTGAYRQAASYIRSTTPTASAASAAALLGNTPSRTRSCCRGRY